MLQLIESALWCLFMQFSGINEVCDMQQVMVLCNNNNNNNNNIDLTYF